MVNSGILIPTTVITAFWLFIGAILPWFIRGEYKGLIQVSLVTAAVCFWTFWVTTWLMQWHPLIGPEIKGDTLYIMQNVWGFSARSNIRIRLIKTIRHESPHI